MNEKIKSRRYKFMSLNSMKKLEEKLEKKKSKLQTLENRKSEIEEKIKESHTKTNRRFRIISIWAIKEICKKREYRNSCKWHSRNFETH